MFGASRECWFGEVERFAGSAFRGRFICHDDRLVNAFCRICRHVVGAVSVAQ